MLGDDGPFRKTARNAVPADALFSSEVLRLLHRPVGESLLIGREKFSMLDGDMEAWMASGMPVADRIEKVNAERAYEAFAEGVTVLDMRRPNEYEAGHVEGAIHVSL